MGMSRVTIPLSRDINEDDLAQIETLARELGAMGIAITLPDAPAGSTLVFEYDPEAYKRGAGRKRKSVPSGGALGTMNVSELDDWLVATDADAVAEGLGVSRSTAYRRKAEARQRVEHAMVRVEEDERKR
ncbi:MAG: hypothetical protein V8R08_00850 [Coriobacteriales bacterium]